MTFSQEKLKTQKDTKVNKITKDQIKTIYATLGALSLIDTDLKEILNELGYMDIKEVKPDEVNKVITKIKELAKARKGK